MALTLTQKLAISTGIVGAATSAFGALNSVMTPIEALVGTVLLGFISGSLGVVSTVLSSSGQQIKAVSELPGVDRIAVNAKATDGLAAAALDPSQPKVDATTPEVRAVLAAKAPS